jgi:hypothetical protein
MRRASSLRRYAGATVAALWLVVLLPATLYAQDSESADRKVVSVEFEMIDAGAGALDVAAGVVLADFLTLSLAWNLGFRIEADTPATELGLGLDVAAELFTQGEFLPVTVVLDGAFLKSRYYGVRFDEEELMKSGTSYRAGLAVTRSFGLGERLSLIISVSGAFIFDNEITEARPGSGSNFVTHLDTESGYRGGFEVVLDVPLSGPTRIGFGIRAGVDNDLHVIYGPVVSLSG